MSYKISERCLYADSHEWVRAEGNTAVVGISDYAQNELSDVVFVDLPDEGDTFKAGEAFGVLESVKAASDVYLPISGTIIAVNSALEDSPELVNEDCYGKGWLVKIEIKKQAELDELMDSSEYEESLEEED